MFIEDLIIRSSVDILCILSRTGRSDRRESMASIMDQLVSDEEMAKGVSVGTFRWKRGKKMVDMPPVPKNRGFGATSTWLAAIFNITLFK